MCHKHCLCPREDCPTGALAHTQFLTDRTAVCGPLGPHLRPLESEPARGHALQGLTHVEKLSWDAGLTVADAGVELPAHPLLRFLEPWLVTRATLPPHTLGNGAPTWPSLRSGLASEPQVLQRAVTCCWHINFIPVTCPGKNVSCDASIHRGWSTFCSKLGTCFSCLGAFSVRSFHSLHGGAGG